MPVAQPHTAKAMVFTCMDERLEPAIRNLVHSLPGGAFHAAMAGGGAAFAFETDKPVAVKQVVAAFKINHITDLYLQSHTSCGAYGLAGVTFNSDVEEAGRLYADLAEAKQIVAAALAAAGAKPNEVTIHTDVIDLTGHRVAEPELSPSHS